MHRFGFLVVTFYVLQCCSDD